MFLSFSCWAATFWTSWSHSNQNSIKIPGGRHFSDSKPIYCQVFFSPFIFCAHIFKSIMTWGERGRRSWTYAHHSGQCPPATWTRTARQGLFPTLNSVPSSLESLLLLKDIKQLINFSFPLNKLQKTLGPTWDQSCLTEKNKTIQLLLIVFIILDFFIPSHVIWWFVKAVWFFFIQSPTYLRENLIIVSI